MLDRKDFPRLYAIVDAGVLTARGIALEAFAQGLRQAEVMLVQYRDKDGSPQQILAAAKVLRDVFAGTDCTLIMNDRADLCVLADFDGVHVGQEDLSPEDVRRIIGKNRLIGLSTHNEAQLRRADASCADYLAIGPVFGTGTKVDPDPVVGPDGIRMARELTRKPLVAIGGITRENARSVIDAGADAVAVISGLLRHGESVEQVARDFLELLR
jgi:thiamine-phosphate pyrophosphorylase